MKATISTNYYQHFDADFSMDVPGEGYSGWKKTDMEIDMSHTAIVLMHAWDHGTREQYPGWHRAVEYIPREIEIEKRILPGLLSSVRKSGMKLYHVVDDFGYFENYPGYRRAVGLAGSKPEPLKKIKRDPVLEELFRFKSENSFPGRHNIDDIEKGFKNVNFPAVAKPIGDEGIAMTGNQLFALCEKDGVNHLIYTGFALDACLLLSPCGMLDMYNRGFMCSVIREAVTAVENRETARNELCKNIGLWRVAMYFGFVYDVDDFLKGIRGM